MGAFVQWEIKDSLFASIFVLYSASWIAYALKGEQRMLAVVLIGAVGVGLLWNNGFFIILLSLLWLLCFTPSSRRAWISFPIIACIICIPLLNLALVVGANAVPGSLRELLSVPLQQTARYVLCYDSEMPNEDRAAIDAVVPYEGLDRYNPNNADLIKNQYREDAGALPGYIGAWLRGGLQHPGVYVEATVLNTYGYWYLESTPSYPLIFAEYSQDPPDRYLGREGVQSITHQYDWSYLFPVETRAAALRAIALLRSIPLVSLFCQPAIYTWLLIFCFGFLAYAGRAKWMLAFMGCAVLLLTAVAGPVNGYFRYVLGMAACTPLMLWAAFYLGCWEKGPRMKSAAMRKLEENALG